MTSLSGEDIRRSINLAISIVMPTLNEARAIGGVLRDVNGRAYDVLVVDGNSKDGTPEIARRLGARVLVQKGRGKGAALRQAFDIVDGDIIIMIDADGSMQPREIDMYIKALASGADLVRGSRFLPGGGSEDLSIFRRFGNMLFVSLVNFLWSTNYTDLCYGFAGFRKEALKKLYPSLKSKNFEIETEIFIKAKKLGLKVAEVPSVERRRRHGKSNLSGILDGSRILLTILEEFLDGWRKRNRES